MKKFYQCPKCHKIVGEYAVKHLTFCPTDKCGAAINSFKPIKGPLPEKY